jgi:hypothetical protein
MGNLRIPADYATVAGLAAIIERIEPTHEVVEQARSLCEEHRDAMVQYIQSELLPKFMLVLYDDDEAERQLGWYQIYLDFGALFFVDGQLESQADLNAVLVGINERWADIVPFASWIQSLYPVAAEDQTRDLLRVSCGDYHVVEESDEPVNVIAYKMAQSAESMEAELDAWDGGFDMTQDEVGDFSEPMVMRSDTPIRICADSAEGSGARSRKQVAFAGSLEWHLMYVDGASTHIMLKGAPTATVYFNDSPVDDVDVEGQTLRCTYQAGVWRFVIGEESYSFEF